MTLRDRIPVEPLDGARLDRLEQRIVARAAPLLARPRRSPWTSWAAAGAAALAAAAVLVALGVGRGGGGGDRVTAAAPLAVATDARGTRIDLGDALVEVGPETRFEVVRGGGGIAIELAAGDVALEVPPRRGRPPLWVHAGDVGVRVVGTGFRVRRHVTVEVEVTHGAVEVHRGAALARVATGERWSSLDGAVVALAAAGPPERADVAGAAAIAGAAGTIREDALALGAGAEGPELHDRPAPSIDPRGERSAASGARDEVRPSRSAGLPSAAPSRARAAVRPPTAPAAEPAPADLRAEVQAQPVAPAPLLPAGRPAGTVLERERAYRELGFSKQRDDADAALWGLARLQAFELGKDADALRTLDLYVRRFSAGGQIEPVLWLRVRLLCARKLDAPCRAAAHTYVARFPGTAKGDLAVRVTDAR